MNVHMEEALDYIASGKNNNIDSKYIAQEALREARAAKKVSASDVLRCSQEEHSWEEFRTSGMLWWINRILHTFGWAILLELDSEEKCVRCYPARVRYRGFSSGNEDIGFNRVTEYLRANINTLMEDTKLEDAEEE